uniref:Uncharacterized protein n=1 Tax=Mus musculus TaxID=10090 RepID=Q6PFY3_MOUSE|nr:Unknown (protein for MGC:67274) [Mus musculus]
MDSRLPDFQELDL